MKKKTKIVIFAIILFSAAICLLPIPQKVERHYYVTDSFGGKKADVYVDMTYLKFLILENKMVGKIQVSNDDINYTYENNKLSHMNYYIYPSNNKDKFIHYFIGSYYNDTTFWNNDLAGVGGTDIVGGEQFYAGISPDFNKIFLYHQQSEKLENPQTWQWIGSTDNENTTDLVEYFTGYIKETSIE